MTGQDDDLSDVEIPLNESGEPGGDAATGAKKKKRNKKKKTGTAGEAGDSTAANAKEGESESTNVKNESESKTAGADDDDDDDDDEDGNAGGDAAAGSKKKKKRNKKKKGSNSVGMPFQDNSIFRCLGNWNATSDTQTWPPTKQVSQLYPENKIAPQNLTNANAIETKIVPSTPDGTTAEKFSCRYPIGEIQFYVDKAAKDVPTAESDSPGPPGGIAILENNQAFRTTSAEKRAAEKLMEEDYENIRRAAEVHRQVRRYVQSYCRPGISMIEMCQRLEKKGLELVGKDGLNCGWGFPTGCSLNHVAAHYTPNYGDKTVLTYNDVMKLDFGIQVGGRIVDSAFTIAFNPKYDEAIKSTIDGTNTGLQNAGVDARFCEIGAAIQEVIESYECELDGTVHKMKCVRNLNGHSIGPYLIHAGKSLPIVGTKDQTRMEEGEFYAIETFASTGKGYVIEDYDCSHYMKIYDAQKCPLRLKSAKTLLHGIEENFATLAFARRWLDDAGHGRHVMALKNLVDNDLVQPYPPLVDQKGSIVTQMEHTILIKPTAKEIVSRGDDY